MYIVDTRQRAVNVTRMSPTSWRESWKLDVYGIAKIKPKTVTVLCVLPTATTELSTREHELLIQRITQRTGP